MGQRLKVCIYIIADTHSLYKIVVFPALSKPTMMSLTWVLENSLFHKLLNKMPILPSVCDGEKRREES